MGEGVLAIPQRADRRFRRSTSVNAIGMGSDTIDTINDMAISHPICACTFGTSVKCSMGGSPEVGFASGTTPVLCVAPPSPFHGFML